MSTVHVCLVSDQRIANVLPILSEKPTDAVLLTSREMEEKASLLAEFLGSRGVKTDQRLIPAYGFAEVVEVCRSVIADYADSNLTLNVTGGTKVAALAAYQQFYFDSKRIIYLDTSNNRILKLGDTPSTVELHENLLSVKEYLACYDKYFVPGTSGQVVEGEYKRRKSTAELCRIFIKNPELLFEINRQLAQYKQRRTKPYFGLFPDSLPKGGAQVCSFLLAASVATEGIKGSVNINSDESLFYLHGGWLEEYVYGLIAEIAPQRLDLRMNIEIEWKSDVRNTTRNELDIAFTHRNRLHIISCKTSGLDRGGKNKVKGKEALYELDSLADNIGGLFARSMLVSAHQLGKASLQRASDLGIDVVDGFDVLGLGKHIKNKWLG